MISSIRHVGVVVTDLEKSLFFYRDLLGFSVQKSAQETGPFIEAILAIRGVNVTTVKMSAPDGITMLELLRFESPGRNPAASARDIHSPGLTHVAFTVSDLDGLYRQLAGHRVEFLSQPQRSPDGSARVAFCRDPDGTLIELVEVQ